VARRSYGEYREDSSPRVPQNLAFNAMLIARTSRFVDDAGFGPEYKSRYSTSAATIRGSDSRKARTVVRGTLDESTSSRSAGHTYL
jgi:hypothetical protein